MLYCTLHMLMGEIMKKKLSELSQPEKQIRLKQDDIIMTKKMRTELELLRTKKPNLKDPEAPEITDWQNAVLHKFYRPRKKQITIRLDLDVLEWFMHTSTRYQTLINAVCRSYMLSQKKERWSWHISTSSPSSQTCSLR